MDAMFLSTFWKLLTLRWRKNRKLRWKKQPQASWTSFVPARSPWGLWTCAFSGFLPQCKDTDLKRYYMTSIDCRCYYGLSFASTSLSGDAFTNFLLRCHTAIFFNSSSSSTVHAAHDASYVVNTHQRVHQEDPDLLSLSEFASCFCPSVFIEIPSAICCILVIDCWGRRPTLTFCQVTKLIFFSDIFWAYNYLPGGFWPCLCCLWLAARSTRSYAPDVAGEENEKVLQLFFLSQLCLSLLGKFGASISFFIVYLYTAELFPTTVRNQAVGICSLVARLFFLFTLM